jgi:hypothetical protein
MESTSMTRSQLVAVAVKKLALENRIEVLAPAEK